MESPSAGRLPPRPPRRFIAVFVMTLGLIVPGVVLGLRLLGFYCVGVAPLALSAWLICLLTALWKGRPWAFMLAMGTFGFGFAGSAFVLVGSFLDGHAAALRWSGAATAHFAVSLVAIGSLHPWFKRIEWQPARDPLADRDKKALADGLRRLRNSGEAS